MTSDLPPELWHQIFSHLDLEDLARARRVSRRWWELIDTDRLWKPLLTDRGVTEGCVNLEKEDAADALQCCQWSRTCSTYYNRVPSNWRKPQYRTTKCDLSTEYVVIRLPYMLTTFDPYRVVNVHRLVDGDFMLSSRLPLPDDGEDGCFIPTMSTDTVFVVSKNAYSLIFKLNGCNFQFEKAVCLTEDKNFVCCSSESELPSFLRNTSHSDLISCCCATDDALWLLDEISYIIYVWNYRKSELMFQSNVSSIGWAHSTKKFVYCVLPDQLSVHSPVGQRLFLYRRTQSLVSRFSWDEEGCGFIESRSAKKFAVYLSVSRNAITEMKAVDPEAISIHESARLAYCLCVRDGVASLVTTSLDTGAILKETVVCPSLKSIRTLFLGVIVEMHVVLGKFVAIYGVDGEKPDRFISADHLSLYSLSEEKFLWSLPINTGIGKIIHLSDQFIVTRGRLPRGGMRYCFEIYNFL